MSLAIAIGIGLLIGAERERRKGSGSQRGAAGVRTFALAAFAGALSSYLKSEALLVAVAVAAVLFSALAYRRTARKDPGLTTEFALLVTVLLGALTMQNPLLAVRALRDHNDSPRVQREVASRVQKPAVGTGSP